MALNIKSDKAHHLAAELARRTGKTMTAAVIEALETKIEQINHEQRKSVRFEELMAIGKRCADRLQQQVRAVDHGDILYDEHGLPT